MQQYMRIKIVYSIYICWEIMSQAEAKKLEDFSTYLSLPSTKIELEEKGHSTAGKSMQNLGSCTISKDSFQISTLVCSTKLTQNGEKHNHIIRKILMKFACYQGWKYWNYSG